MRVWGNLFDLFKSLGMRLDQLRPWRIKRECPYYSRNVTCTPFVSCTGIKKYIVGLVIKLATDSTAQEKVFLAKLNIILVQVSVLVILQSSLKTRPP